MENVDPLIQTPLVIVKPSAKTIDMYLERATTILDFSMQPA